MKEITTNIVFLCNEVKKISQHFMSLLEVEYFVYTKSLLNKGVVVLTSNAEILQHSLSAGYTPPSETWHGLATPRGIYIADSRYTAGTWITDGLPAQREKFGIDFPFTLIKTQKEAVKTFTFMASSTNLSFVTQALNQQDLFWVFATYFEEQAKSIIKELTPIPLNFKNIMPLKFITNLLTDDKKQHLLKSIKPNYYLFEYNGQHVRLSKRQCECLQQLFLGKTVKEIGKALSLSPATVQSYLTEIKKKFRCNTRVQLLEIFINNIY